MRVNLSRRERLLILGLATALVLISAWRFVLVPLSRSYAATGARLRSEKVLLQDARSKVSLLAVQAGRTEEARVRFKAASAGFQADLQDGGLIIKLGQAAQAAGVRITQWQPLSVLNRGSYLEMPVRAVVEGPYGRVLSFLGALENSSIQPDLLQIRQLSLSALPQRGSSGGNQAALASSSPDQIEADLFLVFYSLPNPAGRLAEPEEMHWRVGRPDPFARAGLVSPYPGVVPQAAAPSSTAGATYPAPPQGLGEADWPFGSLVVTSSHSPAARLTRPE